MTVPTIAEASKLLRRQKISPVELLRECLAKIEALNPKLNAFITVTADSAFEQAAQAEAEIRRGNWRGPLQGIPVGLKDLIDMAGVPTSAASRVERKVPVKDAALVANLKQAGAILIGKENLHEFAYGGSSVISSFGPVHNPVNPGHITGGSSGGSAAAVASGMSFASIGTDTAGSVREPAALCGIVGLKPSFGLVSTEGVLPLSPSLDHAGPLTRSVEDSAILLDALTGSPRRYLQALDQKCPAWRVGIPRPFFFEDLDQEVADCVEEAISDLETLGCVMVDLEVPVDTDRTLQAAEAYAIHHAWIRTSAERYDPETLRRLRTGENIREDQYQAARGELAHIREEMTAVFRGIDLLVTPTTPIPAPRLSDLAANVDQLRPTELRLLRNTRPANVWGTPAISVPCGLTAEGLPIGLQMIGPRGHDERILQLAFAFERSRKHPPGLVD